MTSIASVIDSRRKNILVYPAGMVSTGTPPLTSIPLNFYKHLVFTSFQYLVFPILAVMGYITWRNKIKHVPA